MGAKALKRKVAEKLAQANSVQREIEHCIVDITKADGSLLKILRKGAQILGSFPEAAVVRKIWHRRRGRIKSLSAGMRAATLRLGQ